MQKLQFLFLFLFLSSCATYYQKNHKFNENFQKGHIQEAYNLLAKDTKKHRNDKLIFLLNKGVVSSMLGKYEESNGYFEQAYRIADDMSRNYAVEAASFLTNPNIVPYRGEDFEVLFIHYYLALNYLKLNKREDALVECKRMDIELKQLNSKYRSDKKYKRDAFIHLLMGIIYDVNKDYNNAFIAYRNAYEIFEQDYSKLFDIHAPEQLKKDLLRTAYLTGFNNEVTFYEQKFNMKFSMPPKKDAELILLWENGVCPVKSEWSVDFALVRNQAAQNLLFVNSALNLSFNFPLSNSQYASSGLSNLNFIRIAFPKYVDRIPYYTSGVVSANGQQYPLEKAEDIGQIAFKTLDERFLLEMGKSLLRFALKKAAEESLRKENQNLGTALGVFNALSEKADTRQWQTLPHAIFYTRVPLKAGKNDVSLLLNGGAQKTFNFSYTAKPGETIFQTYNTTESKGIN